MKQCPPLAPPLRVSLMGIVETEQAKYDQVWDIPGYGKKYSPGIKYLRLFKDLAQPKNDERVIDIGCGDGRAMQQLSDACGIAPFGIDISSVIDQCSFSHVQCSVWRSWGEFDFMIFDYAYCCDVMEHLPTEWVAMSLHRIAHRCRFGFFSICLVPDGYGKKIGQTLHLTVRPFEWWRDLLREFGELIDARDLGANGVYYVRL